MNSRNFAFISYNHKDVKVARWLQKKLESYKLPTEIHNEFEDSRYLRPVFRDQTDLNTGILANTLREQLEASRFLIVLCSPNSARSEWVSKEVESFIKWGRLEYIIPVIIEGQPNCYNPDLECLPTYLRNYTREHPEHELLGISFAEVGRDKAFIRVVSRMLGVSFDTLWQRHERERRRRIVLNILTSILSVGLIYWLGVPYQFTVRLHDAQHQLPISVNEEGNVGIVTVNGVDYAIQSLDTTLRVQSLPGYYRGREIEVKFGSAYYYDSLLVSTALDFGLGGEVDIQMQRDSTFSRFAGTVIDGVTLQPVAGAVFSIDEGRYHSVTDAEGHFSVLIPLADQREYKDVSISCEGYKADLWPEETVSSQAVFKIYK